MISFRRYVLALTVLALFAGLASAQVQGVTPLTCNTNVSVTPTLRSEGLTEQTGDITLQCTGGAAVPVGQAIPQVNIQIFVNASAITSRLIGTGNSSGTPSEALLLIDEPQSGLGAATGVGSGFGPDAAQTVCPTPLSGCIEYSSTFVPTVGPNVGTSIPVATNTAGAANVAAGGQGFNVFQGVVNGNSVTFFGIPVLPPGTVGSRVFRITNIRVNASSLASGGAAPVSASISISGATSLLLSNPTPTIGFVQPGLSAVTTRSSVAGSLLQCTAVVQARVNTLTFTENFGTAFKTRVAATSASQWSGQIQNLAITQNKPGQIYNSESNLIIPIGSAFAGLADYGTRLRASFGKIPTGPGFGLTPGLSPPAARSVPSAAAL